MPSCELDHIVIAAASLDDGVRFIRERLGVDIPAGGRHELMGTHNHLMRVGANCYLEVIAVDPQAAKPARPRWFALDDPAMQARLREGPSLVTWVVRTADVVASMQSAAFASGEVVPMNRDALSWRLTVPRNGAPPQGGVIPHLIEWDGGARPWESMADLGCRLRVLTLAHSDPEFLKRALKSLCNRGFDFVAIEKAGMPKLSAEISTPSGIVRL